MDIEKKIRRQIVLAPYTSMRVGGPARFWVEPECAEEVSQALDWAQKGGEPVFVMGRGTNIIVSDRGFEGLVIRLGEPFAKLEIQNHRIKASAGTGFEQLIEKAVAQGFAGLERLIGIPGCVGGALYMNAGAFDQNTADRVARVWTVNSSGIIEHRREEMQFGYRVSSFQGSGKIILEAEFEFLPGDPVLLRETATDILARRREKQPWDQCSAGSTFKRPPGHFAGGLIEAAGLKGKRIGDAMVSTKHAGFVVNAGQATASDIRALILEIIDTVFANSGVRLEPEVMFVGSFGESAGRNG